MSRKHVVPAAILLLATGILPARAQDPAARPSADWFAAVKRVDERIRSSPISWLDGHLGVCSRIRMSRDGERAVTWAQDGSAWLWNAWTGEPLGLLGILGMGETSFHWEDSKGDELPVFEFSADGERILVFEPVARCAGLWDGRSAEFLGYLQKAGEQVLAAVFAPDGRRVAVAGGRGVIRFYDSERGIPLEAPVLEAGEVLDLSFSADGSRILAQLSDGRARLWDARSGALLGEMGTPELPIHRACFSTDATRVVGTSSGGIALFFSTSPPAGSPLEPRVVRAEEGDFAAVDWGVGGLIGKPHPFSLPIPPRGDRLLVVAVDGAVSLWDPDAGREIAPLPGIEGPPKARLWATFGPDGARLLTIGTTGCKLWDADTGAFVSELEGGAAGFEARYAVFSASGRYFATATPQVDGANPIVRIYDARTGDLMDEMDESLVADGSLQSLHFSESDRLGATSAWGWSVVWDRSRTPVTLIAHTLQLVEEGLDVGLPRWSPTGSEVYTPTWGRVTSYADRLFDPRSGSMRAELHSGNFAGGGFLPGGGLLTLRPTGEMLVRSTQRGGMAAEAGILPGDRILAFGGRSISDFTQLRAAIRSSPSSTTVLVERGGKELEMPIERPPESVVGSRSLRGLGLNLGFGARVAIQHPETGSLARSVRLEHGIPGEGVHQIVVDRGLSRLLVRARDQAAVYDLASGDRLVEFPVREKRGSTTYDSLLHLAAMSPKGDVVAGIQASSVRLWSVTSGRDPVDLPGDVVDLEFSPDGRLLAAASTDGAVLLFDVAEKKLARKLAGHRGEVRFVGFDPDGGRIVSVGQDGTARISSVADDGRQPLVLAGHAGLPNRPSFSADGTRLLTTGDDCTARLWDAAGGAEIAVLEGHVGPVVHAEFSPDGTRILTQARDGSTRIWSHEPSSIGRLLATRVEYDDGWLVFEPGGHYVAGGMGAERAQMVVQGRRYPLSSYAALYESPEKVAASLAGRVVPAPSLVPQAPEVRVAAPLDPLVPERQFHLEVLIEDAYGIDSVHVEQDGRALDAEWVREHVVPSGRTARLSCELALPEGTDQATIKVRATNVRRIQSAPRTVFVRWEPPRRELYVLALGVADYEDDSLDLDYPTKDADDLTERLRLEEGVTFEKVNTRRLVNGDVTPGKLLKAREEFLLRARPEDTIVVFAAGHGVRSESGEYYFLTPGTTPDDPYDGVERQVLESLVTWDRLHAKRRILLLDTCHSGEAFGEGKRGIAADAFDQKSVNEAAGTGLYIIAASSEKGFAQEMRGNGLFTRCLLEGLEGPADRDGDGFVGIEELKNFATAAVHERSAGRQRPTAPRIQGGEDFPLARRRGK